MIWRHIVRVHTKLALWRHYDVSHCQDANKIALFIHMMSFLLHARTSSLFLQYQPWYHAYSKRGTDPVISKTLSKKVHLRWWCNSSCRCSPVRFGFSGHFCPRNHPSVSFTRFYVNPAKIGPPSPDYRTGPVSKDFQIRRSNVRKLIEIMSLLTH